MCQEIWCSTSVVWWWGYGSLGDEVTGSWFQPGLCLVADTRPERCFSKKLHEATWLHTLQQTFNKTYLAMIASIKTFPLYSAVQAEAVDQYRTENTSFVQWQIIALLLRSGLSFWNDQFPEQAQKHPHCAEVISLKFHTFSRRKRKTLAYICRAQKQRLPWAGQQSGKVGHPPSHAQY